jgi:mannosyltransferase OCH1-like enzyme
MHVALWILHAAAMLISICMHAEQRSIPHVDFTVSMKTHALPQVSMTPVSYAFWNRWEELYNLYGPATLQPTEQLRIPQTLHFIWLGSELPAAYAANIRAWQELLPHYTIKLWTEADLDPFNMINRDLFEQEINYAARSDIWRYEILFRHGGIYLDVTDQVPVIADNALEQNSLDSLNYTYDFYIGIQPMDTNLFATQQDTETVMMVQLQLGIGLIGSIPGHPILAAAIRELRNMRHIPVIVARTGPLFFSQVFYVHAGKYGLRDIALPPTYFYPCGYEQKALLQNHDAGKGIWHRPESFAVHLWAGSWLKPSANIKR